MAMDALVRQEVIRTIRTIKERMVKIDALAQIESSPTAFGGMPERAKWPRALHRTSGVVITPKSGDGMFDVDIQIVKSLVGGPVGSATSGENELLLDDKLMEIILLYKERPFLQDEALGLAPLRFAVAFSEADLSVTDAGGGTNSIVFDRASDTRYFAVDLNFRHKIQITLGRAK